MSVRPWTLLCPHDNLSHIWARIIKFVTNMHPVILSAGIENRGPWPSRSFWPFWLRILGNSACPQNNSSQIWMESPNLQQTCILGYPSGIENEGHWSWPPGSFWLFWLRILWNLICPVNKSSQIWARITKFAPNMHPGILWAGIENRGHWPWF